MHPHGAGSAGFRFGALLVIAGTALNIAMAAIRGSTLSMAAILQLAGDWLARRGALGRPDHHIVRPPDGTIG